MSAERPSSVRAFVALSANLGDRAATLDAAVVDLDAVAGVDVMRVSPWFETDPVGGPPGQPDYLNGACEVDTRLDARELLELLLRVEREHGRVRNGVRDSPRTLDLDLLFYGNRRIREPGLVVPHPRLEGRLFVLEPLARLAPQRPLPNCRRTVLERLCELRIMTRARARGAAARPHRTRSLGADAP